MDDISEQHQKLVTAAQKGDSNAFSTLYEHFYPAIYRFLFARTSHKETAEDLTEDVFIKAYTRLEGLSNSRIFSAWLYTIARNTLIDHYRSSKSDVDLTEVESFAGYESNLVDIAETSLTQAKVLASLNKLNKNYAEVLKLRFLEDLSIRTTASLMNETESNVRVLQHRALKELSKILPEDPTN